MLFYDASLVCGLVLLLLDLSDEQDVSAQSVPRAAAAGSSRTTDGVRMGSQAVRSKRAAIPVSYRMYPGRGRYAPYGGYGPPGRRGNMMMYGGGGGMGQRGGWNRRMMMARQGGFDYY